MRVPYFYIIRHIHSNKRYAGSKWAKDANPLNFMTCDGYQTSSSTVHKLIEADGLDSFVIEDVVTEEELKIPFNNYQTVLSYETAFQNYFDCAKNSGWLNSRNNNSSNFNYPLLDESIKAKHKEIMNSPELWERIRNINIDKYGVDHYSKTEEFKQRQREFWKDNEFVSNLYDLYDKEKHKEIMNSPELWEQIRNTNLEKYGVDHYAKTDYAKENYKKVCLEKYGVDNYSKTKEFRDFVSGENSPFKTKEFREKCKVTANNPETIAKRLKTISEQPLIACRVCGHVDKRKSINRYHNDKCGIKETRSRKKT